MLQGTGKKRIVSFDLDMTLLEHKSMMIPYSAMEALRRLREKHIIVLASGRDMDHQLSVEYRNMVNADAVIHLNGAKVEADGEILYEHYMNKACLQKILRYSEMNGIAIGTEIADCDYYTHPEIVERNDSKQGKKTERKFADVWKLMDLPVHTLIYIGELGRIRELEYIFPEFKFPLFVSRAGADVVEKGISKASGLSCLCDYFSVDIKHTIAFGDSMNDYEILQKAGLGIAMGNAVDDLKAAADYITDDISEDGIWNACKHFALI